MSLRELSRTGLYNEVYKHQGVRFQIGIGVNIDGSRIWTAGCGRASRDFHVIDREILHFCQPVIAAILRRIARHERVSVAANSFEAFIKNSDHPYIILSVDGTVIGASPEGLLKIGIPGDITFQHTHRFSEYIKALTHLLFSDAKSHRAAPFRILHESFAVPVLLLRLTKTTVALVFAGDVPGSSSSASDNLTRREREVLGWLAEGKSNDEIGLILGVSCRTVEKHCENIFSKLGVESRLAAALLARDFD